jgi:hypothetical protein
VIRGEGKGTALYVSVMGHIARGEADGDLRCPTSFELFHQLIADFYRDRPFVPERLDDLKRERTIQLFSTPCKSTVWSRARTHLLGTQEVQDPLLVIRYDQPDELLYVPVQEGRIREIRRRGGRSGGDQRGCSLGIAEGI